MNSTFRGTQKGFQEVTSELKSETGELWDGGKGRARQREGHVCKTRGEKAQRRWHEVSIANQNPSHVATYTEDKRIEIVDEF